MAPIQEHHGVEHVSTFEELAARTEVETEVFVLGTAHDLVPDRLEDSGRDPRLEIVESAGRQAGEPTDFLGVDALLGSVAEHAAGHVGGHRQSGCPHARHLCR